MGHSTHCKGQRRQPAEAAGAQAAARLAALADTPTRVCRPGQSAGSCPACREALSLLRRQNRLLEELFEAMGVRP